MTGSSLDNLLFISNNAGPDGGPSDLILVDISTLQTVALAEGGTRGDMIITTADGRVLISQSGQVDILNPRTAPRILAVNPPNNAIAALPLATVRITFDQPMLADDPAAPGSVTNIANFALSGPFGQITILGAVYDALSRTVELTFDPIDPGLYELVISDHVESVEGSRLTAAVISQFTAVSDLSAVVEIAFTNPRSDRLAGTVSYDVTVTNIDINDLALPLSLVIAPRGSFDGQPLDSFNELDGVFFLDLSVNVPGGVLAPGETTFARTVTIANADALRVILDHDVFSLPEPNQRPVFETVPVVAAAADEAYVYQAAPTDPEGTDLAFVLSRAPEGMTVDPVTGLVLWTPVITSPARVQVILYAFDTRGGAARQEFFIDVANVNLPPVISLLPEEFTGTEGEALEFALTVIDPEGDTVLVRGDFLPPGAVFDPATMTLRWTPGPNAAGKYDRIAIIAEDIDGSGQQTRAEIRIVVLPANQAPTLNDPADRSLREGGSVVLQLIADDPDGDDVTFGSGALPEGAVLFTDSGRFQWTPSFTQAGIHEVAFSVSDSVNIATQTVIFTVINQNAAPVFDPLGAFRALEDQPLSFRAFAFDPDNPDFIPQFRVFDELTVLAGSDPTVTYQATGVPAGAVFDVDTAILDWTPTFDDAGEYVITFTATDDGDGTGVALFAQVDVRIIVVNANRTPQLTFIDNQALDAFDTLDLAVTAVDPDGNPLEITYYV